MRHRSMLRGAGIFTLIVATMACQKPPENLILVTMDTTRADHIACYGADAITPVIDSLAARGTVFERAFTVAPITAPAHASILTGKYPPYHQVRDNGTTVLPDQIVTLAERFAGAGYQTAGIVSAYPVRGIFGFSQGFDYFSDSFDATPGNVIVTNLPTTGMQRRPGEVVAREFVAWLGQNKKRPFFAWLHFFDPHMPYEAPAAFSDLLPGRPYDAEIAYMDHSIGLVAKALDAAGLSERTGWVLAGDHGEGLGEHNENTHALLAYNSTLNVPLIMTFPWLGEVAARSDVPVSVVDIVPTVAELFGLEPSEPGATEHGRSLIPLVTGQGDNSWHTTRSLYFENMLPFNHFRWTRMTGIVQHRLKLINSDGEELFDLDRDFAELAPIDDEAASGRLQEALQKTELTITSGRPEMERAELDGEAIRQLQALGYVGAGAEGPDPDSLDSEILMSPDEGLVLWYLYDKAQRAARDGRLFPALDQLRTLLELQPVHKDARLLFAHVANLVGDLDLASATYEELLADRPEIDVLHQAALFYMTGGGDLDRARNCLERLLVRSPRDIDALTQLARVELKARRPEQAERVLQQAIEVSPGARDALILLARIKHTVHGDTVEAEELLRSAVAAHPFDKAAHFNLAVLLSRTGRIPEAEQHLQRASSFAPGGVFGPAHLALARFHAERGETDAARRYLEQLMVATGDVDLLDQAQAALAQLEEQDH